MNNGKYNISFSVNKDYLPYLMVTLYSVLHNNKDNYFNVYILHNGNILEEDINQFIKNNPLCSFNNYQVHLIDVSNDEFIINKKQILHWGIEIFFKVLLPSYIPKNIDKILHLDVDLIVNGNLDNVFNTNMFNHLFLGDSYPEGKNATLNVGALLINLELAREEKVEEQMKKLLNENKELTEENCINALYQDKIKFTNDIFTIGSRRKQGSKKELKEKVILHYVARKPWLMAPFRKNGVYLTSLYFDYLKPFINNKIMFYILKIYTVYISRIIYSIVSRLRKYLFHNKSRVVRNNNFIKKQILQSYQP